MHADSILDSEPPKHTRLRRLVAGAFGRGHVQRLAPRIEELAAGLLADLPDGEFDVIEDYAEPLPVLVIAELLGVPEADRHHLRPWSQAIVRMYEVDRTEADEAAAREAAGAFAAYVEELAAERAKAPGDDLLTDLVTARDGSDRLSAHELVATAVLLLNAGHEASVNGFGNGLHSWLTAPDRQPLDVGDDAALARDGRGVPAARLAPPPLRADREGARRGGRDLACSRATRSPRCSERPTVTRRSSPTPTGSTPRATRTRTSPSGPASTSASVRRWPGSSSRSRCAPCSPASPDLQVVEAPAADVRAAGLRGAGGQPTRLTAHRKSPKPPGATSSRRRGPRRGP